MTPTWNADTCDATMRLFENARRKREEELDALLAEAERNAHETINTFLAAIERLEAKQ
jgi:hypothetical protein